MLPSKQELSNLLGILYDAAGDPSLWAPFTEKLARRAKSTSAALLVQVFDQGLYSLSNSWQLPETFVREYQEHYHSLDVWAAVALPNPSGYVCTSQSLCPLQQLKRTEFYNDSLALGGIEHGMFALLENNESCLASVCLYRNKTGTEFKDSDLQILKFFAPHLQRAFKLHLRFSELRAQSTGAEAAFDLLPTGVVLIGPRTQIVFMNRRARAILAEKDGLLATASGLRGEHHAESDTLTRTVQQAALTSNGKGFSAGGTVLISRRARPALQLCVSPIHNSGIQTSRQVTVAIFINDPLRSQRAPQELLRMEYGLTPAECRVALLLGDGHAPRKIAEMIGVTENTVRSQIKTIFSKMGVRRQSELVRVLLNSAGPVT
jgi:DNA-binding CsgD family transcriptional regulator